MSDPNSHQCHPKFGLQVRRMEFFCRVENLPREQPRGRSIHLVLWALRGLAMLLGFLAGIIAMSAPAIWLGPGYGDLATAGGVLIGFIAFFSFEDWWRSK